MLRTWSIRRRSRRRGGGRWGWRKAFEAEDSKGWGRATRLLITRLQREHVRYYHDFLLSLFLSHFWDDFQDATWERQLLALWNQYISAVL
jgi:hypothetical protein